jgi:hypothetical protein
MPMNEGAARALNTIHALPEAKTVRAAALHYTFKRDKYGPAHPLTRDAEENLYRQMFALHPVATKALQEMMK